METQIKHIYWFACYNLSCPSTRYRGFMPLNHLNKEGISSDFIFPQKSFKGLFSFICLFFKILFFRKRNSIIVVQKVFSNQLYANALKVLISLRNKNTLYDLDDAEQYRRGMSTINFFLKNCERVSVGSDFLKQYCLQFNKNVFLQTSPVSVLEKIEIPFKKNDKIHIGWVGDFGQGFPVSKTFSHKASLYELLFPNLTKLDYPIKLSLIGVKNNKDIPEIKKYFSNSPHIELNIPTKLNWTNDSWLYHEISKFDIGISLMVDHPFNQAKSAFKAKQYLACGTPVLANDIGETSNYVFDKINGFICRDNQEIVAAINTLKNMNAKDYRQLSKECLKSIHSFSVERYCRVLLDNFEKR